MVGQFHCLVHASSEVAVPCTHSGESRGPLRNCETPNFAKVRFQLCPSPHQSPCHIFGIIMSPWLRPGPSVHYYAAACNCFILIRGRPQETVIRPPRPQHWTVFSQLVGHTFCAKGIKSTCLNYAQCFLSKYLRWTTFMVGCTAPHCHCPSVTSWTCWVGLTTIIFICLIAIAEIAAQNDLYVQQSVAPRTGASQIYPYLAV